MKNNIAILSLYYRNANYGGVLQAYALQRVLEEQGNCVKQISYDLLSGYKKPHKHGWYKIIAELYHLLKYRGWMLEFHRRQKLIYDFADTIPESASDVSVEQEVIADMSLRQALDRLKPGEREIVHLKIMGEMTFQEIADMLKAPLGTVTWRYQNAIQKLRRCGYE